ncbi:MAG TPA: serine/threonine-protein kinase [Candidatus Krumholzibacteria bacterium]|nr:serine/threonine-protein kinase [Candidatus Krumholzibacteria bacterium]
MSHITSRAIARLREAVEFPDLAGTQYDAVEAIGRGGMGTVFRVHDRELARDVALKVLSAREVSEDARARMLDEARILARLEHPGIVPVHDVGVLPDGRVFYTMKLVRGSRLDEYARATHEIADLLRVFVRACEAVAFAHSEGVVHRDMKPSNVMVGAFGEVLVLDWGVAKLLDRGTATETTTADAAAPSSSAPSTPPRRSADTATGAVLGTPGFMAPEQARGESAHVDPRSDVYALGAMLRQILQASRAGAMPRRLRAICDRATAVDPAARYPDVASLSRDVERFATGQAVTAYKEHWTERARRLASRHRIAVTLIAAYLLMRVLIFFLDRP